MELNDLYSYAERRGIDVDDFTMRELTSAAFPDGCIVMDSRKVRTEAEEKVLLAHEVGHIETGSFYNVASPCDVKAKHEHRADVWSFRRLIPREDLLKALRSGLTEAWELAEYFGVTEDYIIKAAEYWRQGGRL